MRIVGALMVMLQLLVIGSPPRARAADPATEKRLRNLERALEDAQKEIQRLQDEVKRERSAREATSADVAETKKTQTEQQTKIEQASKASSLPDWLKRVSLFGDVRLRYEGFYNQPETDGTDVTARNRERLRARIGLKVNWSDELSATVRLATGNPDDPISTNETFDNIFTPGHINLDWAYLTLTPGTTFGIRPGLFSVSGGKMPNPIFRTTEMVFDDDLSPTGASEVVQLLGSPVGILDQVRIHAFQWTFDEVSNGDDGWLFGGQVNPVMHTGPVEVEAGVGQYGYYNADLIAEALNSNSSLKNTNLVNRNADGDVVGFQSNFNLTNLTLGVTLKNAVHGMPLRFFTDYVYNWGAATDDRQGVTAGLKLGQTKQRRDWAATAYYEYIGQEAAVSEFTASDFGLGEQPTRDRWSSWSTSSSIRSHSAYGTIS